MNEKTFTGVFLIMAFDSLRTFTDGYYDLFEVPRPEESVVQPEFPAPQGNRTAATATRDAYRNPRTDSGAEVHESTGAWARRGCNRS